MDQFEELPDESFGCVQFYRHRASGLPFVYIPGGGGPKGEIIGAVLLWRAADNSMNMECEVTFGPFFEQTLRFIGSEMPTNKSAEERQDMWAKFKTNLMSYLQQKRWIRAEATEPKVEEDCMICLDKKADTVVVPCMHRVVCASCSESLKATNDAHICCQCRKPIDGVRKV